MTLQLQHEEAYSGITVNWHPSVKLLEDGEYITKYDWMRALKSPVYKQGRTTLCKVNEDLLSRSNHTNNEVSYKYCCLGVLASIVGIPNRIMLNDKGCFAFLSDLTIYKTGDKEYLSYPSHKDGESIINLNSVLSEPTYARFNDIDYLRFEKIANEIVSLPDFRIPVVDPFQPLFDNLVSLEELFPR